MPVLDAAYRIDVDDLAWLRGIVDTARPGLDAGLGVAASSYQAHDRTLRVQSFANAGSPLTAAEIRGLVARSNEPSADGRRQVLCDHARRSAHDRTWRALEARGIFDIFVVNAFAPSGDGIWLGSFLPRARPPSTRMVACWSRIAEHFGSAVALRRRVREANDNARSRNALARVALDYELQHDRPRALRALDLGATGWTLVDEVVVEGRSYVLARRDADQRAGIDRLTRREREVLGLAAAGQITKVIAFDLGISDATVRVLLGRAARRLGALNRREALARFAAARQ